MAQMPTPMRFTAIPKYTTFQVEVPDPTDENPDNTKISDHKIYHKGSGCPAPVVIEMDNVFADYEENYPTPQDRKTLSVDRYLAKARRANILMYRDTLVATTFPPLSFDAANSLANDEENESGLRLLIIAGWKDEPVPMPDNSEEQSEVEEKTEDETPKGEDVTGA